MFDSNKLKHLYKKKTVKGFDLTEVQDIFQATHWIPTIDDERSELCDVTPYNLYRLNYDQYEKEHFVINDKKQSSYPFNVHNGRLVTLNKIIYIED